MNTPDSIEDRVRRGALLLDMEAPGWVYQINENELDLGSCLNCILGQVYGHYIYGLEHLGLPEDDLDYGFVDSFVNCHALAAAWLIEIRARLAPEPDEVEPDCVGMVNAPAIVP